MLFLIPKSFHFRAQKMGFRMQHPEVVKDLICCKVEAQHD